MVQIALFPIPNCVIFPGNRFPLHVFEPRYRSMIHHCVNNDIPLGVCHTEKVLRDVPPAKDKKTRLNSNQSTYKPHSVFSAGKCKIAEVFDDGRLHVKVHADRRYIRIKDTQTLPFIICEAEEYHDTPLIESQSKLIIDKANALKEKVYMRLCALSVSLPKVHESLQNEIWLEKSPEEFSFDIFSIVQLQADTQQRVLESQSADERLNLLLYQLNEAS